MKRMFGAAAVLVFAAAAANAHFPFILPEADGNAVKVVFSDELTPDRKVELEKISSTKLFARDVTTGKDTPLTWKKGEGFYSAALPGGSRVVYGVTDYGVLQKGDAKPFRLMYYPKALVGDVPAKAATIGEPLKVEVIPAPASSRARFQVLHEGKPVAGAEYTVLTPGGPNMKKAGKTDKEGYTEGFDSAGRYGVSVRVTEAKPGEAGGRKFDETRHYATLVVDVK
jgi:uncharacterized GH25 family protein